MDEVRLELFATGGFSAFPDSRELRAFASYLDTSSGETNSAITLFLAEAVTAVYAFVLEHEEYGGVRLDFWGELDGAVRHAFPKALREASRMRDFRDQIRRMLHNYNPG